MLGCSINARVAVASAVGLCRPLRHQFQWLSSWQHAASRPCNRMLLAKITQDTMMMSLTTRRKLAFGLGLGWGCVAGNQDCKLLANQSRPNQIRHRADKVFVNIHLQIHVRMGIYIYLYTQNGMYIYICIHKH